MGQFLRGAVLLQGSILFKGKTKKLTPSNDAANDRFKISLKSTMTGRGAQNERGYVKVKNCFTKMLRRRETPVRGT